jgi:tripartite-type tricarboxylate transporter receptor subunit TctC
MNLILRSLACLAAVCALGSQAAESWPTRTVTIVAPGPPGSTSDLFARLVADGLAKELGRTVIVENRPGAGTLLGAQVVARAKPDGHTLLIGAAALAIGPHIYRNIAFDPIRELQPVRVIAHFPNVVVVSGAGSIKTVTELLDVIRANPGRYNYASGGVGISEHLAGELFKSMTGTDIVHVPFKGSTDAGLAVVTGDALVDFGNIAAVLPQVKAGKLRAIAVTSRTRSSSLPDVPTMSEAGVTGYDVSTWFGLLAPAATPPDVVRVLDQATQRLLALPQTKERLRLTGAEAADDGPKAFAALVSRDFAKWGEVVRKADIRAD